jgi:ribosomal protein L16 Arg81 hydroxylase
MTTFSVQGLKAENDLTIQTKALLEQKIEALTSRSEALDDLQEQYAATKAQLESLQQEKEMDSEKIEELLARNAHLELEFKH